MQLPEVAVPEAVLRLLSERRRVQGRLHLQVLRQYGFKPRAPGHHRQDSGSQARCLYTSSESHAALQLSKKSVLEVVLVSDLLIISDNNFELVCIFTVSLQLSIFSPLLRLFLFALYFSACFSAGTKCGDECTCTDCGNVANGGKDDDAKPAAEPASTLDAAAPAGPDSITPRDAPEMMEPAKAADKIDVTPDSVYRPVISEQAAV